MPSFIEPGVELFEELSGITFSITTHEVPQCIVKKWIFRNGYPHSFRRIRVPPPPKISQTTRRMAMKFSPDVKLSEEAGNQKLLT